ncbi:MAG: methylenetetrahydrofolate reductase C-terminal domain-containing protein [Alphaproteobacteria bacterium]|jgi:hypothetical protein
MHVIRRWSGRNARLLNFLYRRSRDVLEFIKPLLRGIGYDRLDRPMALIERPLKSLLFDCRMCGDCALVQTGMVCPMTCPKQLRNGPCGGVRPDGGCEIEPAMRCVWVVAWDGAKAIDGDAAMAAPMAPVDHRRKDTSAWINLLRDADAAAAERARR